MEDGLGWYIEELEHRTLFYLDEKSKIFCFTAWDNSGPYKNDEVSTHAFMKGVRERYHYLQSRREYYAHDTLCAPLFKSFQLDGIREGNVDRPICRNNNGSKPIPKKTWCEDLLSAEQFIVTGWPRSDWRLEACGTPDINTTWYLPTCEYDCDHPTICVRTGRYRSSPPFFSSSLYIC